MGCGPPVAANAPVIQTPSLSHLDVSLPPWPRQANIDWMVRSWQSCCCFLESFPDLPHPGARSLLKIPIHALSYAFSLPHPVYSVLSGEWESLLFHESLLWKSLMLSRSFWVNKWNAVWKITSQAFSKRRKTCQCACLSVPPVVQWRAHVRRLCHAGQHGAGESTDLFSCVGELANTSESDVPHLYQARSHLRGRRRKGSGCLYRANSEAVLPCPVFAQDTSLLPSQSRKRTFLRCGITRNPSFCLPRKKMCTISKQELERQAHWCIL